MTISFPQSLIGDIDNAMRTFLNYYTVWKQFGGLPEFYNIPQGYTVEKREGYPLRPGKPCVWFVANLQALSLHTLTLHRCSPGPFLSSLVVFLLGMGTEFW